MDVASLLPPDDSAYGFDNIADVLGVSPSLQERYLSAAEKISALAVGDVHAAPATETFAFARICRRISTSKACRSVRSAGSLIRHTFPLDAEYDFKVKFFRTNFGNLRGLEHPHQVEITRRRPADASWPRSAETTTSRRVREADRHGRRHRRALAVRLPLDGRPAHVTVAFVENLRWPTPTRLQPFLRSSADTLDWTGRPHIDR